MDIDLEVTAALVHAFFLLGHAAATEMVKTQRVEAEQPSAVGFGLDRLKVHLRPIPNEAIAASLS
jgi:hypothetical protein